MSHDKPWGKALTDATFKDGLREYFLPNAETSRDVLDSRYCRQLRQLVDEFVLRVKQLRAHMLEQRDFCFFSSSLLLVYDADALLNETNLNVELRMIDMAHVVDVAIGAKACASVPNAAEDNGYVFGLNHLMRTLVELRDEFNSELDDR